MRHFRVLSTPIKNLEVASDQTHKRLQIFTRAHCDLVSVDIANHPKDWALKALGGLLQFLVDEILEVFLVQNLVLQFELRLCKNVSQKVNALHSQLLRQRFLLKHLADRRYCSELLTTQRLLHQSDLFPNSNRV